MLLSSAEAIYVGSTIKAKKRVHDRQDRAYHTNAAKEVRSWTNSELLQLKGQVKSLSLHLSNLNAAVADQSVPSIKAGVKKLTQEVHNCKAMFSTITEFSSEASRCPPEDEYGADCVSPDLLDQLRDSISSLFADPFLDKIPDYLGVYSQSDDSSVQQTRSKISDMLKPLHHHHHHHGDATDENREGKMRRFTDCLSTLDKELIENEELLKTPHKFVAEQEDVVMGEAELLLLDSGDGMHGHLRDSSLVKGFMQMIVTTALIGFLFPFFIAFTLVFAVIYTVASFLGLNFITKAQDHAVVHVVKKVNEAINSVIPAEGIKIAEIRHQRQGGRRVLIIN